MEFKVNFGDPKTGKTVKKVVSDKQAEVFLKKRIGDKIKGDDFGFEGYEFEITGGSDYCGFPMRKDVRGTSRKRVLVVSGVGIRKNKKSRKGKKIRKTVAGSTIYSRTAQINLKIVKYGAKPLAEEKPSEGEAPKEEKKAPEAEKKAEAPKEEGKPETPKEEKKEDKPVEKPKEATESKQDSEASKAEPLSAKGKPLSISSKMKQPKKEEKVEEKKEDKK